MSGAVDGTEVDQAAGDEIGRVDLGQGSGHPTLYDPTLYATRHVVINVVGTAVAILGIGALLSAFFGRLLPAIDLGWIPDVQLGWAKYVIGFPVAVSVAVREVRRRKRFAADPGEGRSE